jgi:hypothetical protein
MSVGFRTVLAIVVLGVTSAGTLPARQPAAIPDNLFHGMR